MNAVQRYGRLTEGFEARLQTAIHLLQLAAAQHPGHIVLATSLGAEDMVLTDMIVRLELPIALATLETGALHAQTLSLLQELQVRRGITIETYRPEPAQVLHFLRQHGEKAMYQSLELRKACCALRKLEPLARLLQGRSAWVAGLRREQSSTRATVLEAETDAQGRTKFNPLLNWTRADVWHYIGLHQVPYNALHDNFYPSIGCEPCTRAVALGEDERSGRWWWEDSTAKECGLHVAPPFAPSPLSESTPA
jgi:phosphoadenosine phosphosulfate reductase